MTTTDNDTPWMQQPIPTSLNFAILTVLLTFDLLLVCSPIAMALQLSSVPLGMASDGQAICGTVLLMGIGLPSTRLLFRAWRHDLYDMLGLLHHLHTEA